MPEKNIFAGSIFNIEPGTDYEVRIPLHDPDGGEADKTVTVRTREVPEFPKSLRTLHVWPHLERNKQNSFTNFIDAVKELKPGDLVFIHKGSS